MSQQGRALVASDDYASLVVGERDFYYGYEQTAGDDDVWCFVFTRDGAEVLRIPGPELTVRRDDFDSMTTMLLHGIARCMIAGLL